MDTGRETRVRAIQLNARKQGGPLVRRDFLDPDFDMQSLILSIYATALGYAFG